jgi:hypothetical protein
MVATGKKKAFANKIMYKVKIIDHTILIQKPSKR